MDLREVIGVMRFLFGVLTAVFLLGLFAVGWSVLSVLERRMEMAVAAAELAEQEQLARAAEVDAPDPEEVARARADRNVALERALEPDAPLREVSDGEAVQASRLANALRTLTGDLPDTSSRGGLIDFDSGADMGSFEERMRDVTPRYFEAWDDLMGRCFAFVARHERMDQAGLAPKGDERLDYDETYSEQAWHAPDKAFTVKAEIFDGYGTQSGTRRNCSLRSNRFALANSAAVGLLKDRFHDWWSASGFARDTVALKPPYKLHKAHRWYGGQTRFGSVQGCSIKVVLSEITLADEVEVHFFIVETDDGGCTAPQINRDSGGVRVNRLPQATN